MFSLSSLANTAWIFAWHYDVIPLSAVLLVVILSLLAMIVVTLRRANLTGRQRLLVGLPFSVYFGWSTVAVVANITVLLVYWKWDRFGLAEPTWAVIIILVAMAIGTVTMLRNRDVAYGLVLIWAFAGILLRQTSAEGLAGEYPVIIVAVVVSLVVYPSPRCGSCVSAGTSRRAEGGPRRERRVMGNPIAPLDLSWLLMESPSGTTHVGAMLLFKKPPGAGTSSARSSTPTGASVRCHPSTSFPNCSGRAHPLP